MSRIFNNIEPRVFLYLICFVLQKSCLFKIVELNKYQIIKFFIFFAETIFFFPLASRRRFIKKSIFNAVPVLFLTSILRMWWEWMDLNHRSETQQIYSLPPLTTWVHSHKNISRLKVRSSTTIKQFKNFGGVYR